MLEFDFFLHKGNGVPSSVYDFKTAPESRSDFFYNSRVAGSIKIIFWVFGFFCSAAILPAQPAGQEVFVAGSVSRAVIREAFARARTDPELTAELAAGYEREIVPDLSSQPAVVISYYGALKGLQAKWAGNPAKKLALLAECLRVLDQAVAKDGDDLEVRFVRFATLHHLPPVLGVGEKRGRDVGTICDALARADFSVVDEAAQREMAAFMIESRRLNGEQRKVLKNFLAGVPAKF